MQNETIPPASTPITADAAQQPHPSQVLQPATATQQTPPPQPVTLGTTLALCAVTAAFTLMTTFYGPPIAAKFGFAVGASTNTSSKVVYLDFDRVLAAGIKRSMEADNLAIADVQKDAEKFQMDIAKNLQQYADNGYVVINSKALIKASPIQDITSDLIKRLGMKPEAVTKNAQGK